ncbi:MAG: hypothetical protein DRP83_02025 [Planctomycetota bacterium]|nr:MAG: hypothetical protein DRP83_02025 [Planctomycetota bacterium]
MAAAQQNDDMLRELLRGIVGACPDVEENPDVRDYDFLQPHRFTPEHLERLDEFGQLAARMMTASLKKLLGPATEIKFLALAEEYAQRQDAASPCFRIPITVAERVVAWLELPSPTALAWITQLLGGIVDDSINQPRSLSSLESDLLVDISTKVLAAIDGASQESAGPAMELRPSVESLPVEVEIDEEVVEFCRLTFQPVNPEAELSFALVVFSDVVEPIAGLARPEPLAPAETQADMREHIERVTVSVKARLDEVDLMLQDIALLSQGDVLMLGLRVGEPIDVIISGKKIMKGLPVQNTGRYGVQIQTMGDDI